MKLSDRIRRGASLTSPETGFFYTSHEGRVRTCALGAACVTKESYHDKNLVANEAAHLLTSLPLNPDVSRRLGYSESWDLGDVIIDFNDLYQGPKDPRLIIADALEEAGL